MSINDPFFKNEKYELCRCRLPPLHLMSDKQTVMEEVQYSDVLLENSDTSHSKDSK